MRRITSFEVLILFYVALFRSRAAGQPVELENVTGCFNEEVEFVIIKDVVNFDEAVSGCESLGMTLARVGSLEEHEFLLNLSEIAFGDTNFNLWIGNDFLTLIDI